MKMEHIVQFAIGIDDDAIRKRVVEAAEREIIGDIKRQVLNQIFESRSYYQEDATPDDPMQLWVKDLIIESLKEKESEIVLAAAKILADRLPRTKTFKNLLEKMKEETENGMG